jgi:ferredoxin
MAAMVRIRIFPHDDAEWTAEGPARLLDLLDDRGGGLPVSCRGANCGVCRVRVRRGADLLAPAERRERETLDLLHAASDERLGCQVQLRDQADGELVLMLSSSSESAGS